jgi:hypothetical protein
MPSYHTPNPAAFTNAFNTQRQLGAQLRAADQDEQIRAVQLDRMREINALAKNPNATPEQFVRAGDIATGNALMSIDESRQEQMRSAFPSVGAMAAQIRGIQDPQQKRLAWRTAIEKNAPLFDVIGVPAGQAIAQLDALDDAKLDEVLGGLSQFAPRQAPIKVNAGDSLVRPDGRGGYESVYTAPSAPGGDNPFGNINPSEYTPASVARFQQTRNYGDLVPRDKPADPNAAFSHAATLRDDFRVESQKFRDTADSYQRIVDSSANPSPAGDIALLFNYLKVLDPGSTVREGEFQTVGNAGGLPTRVQSLYNRMVNGMLPADVRTDVVGRATQLYRGQEGRFKTQVLDRYHRLARRYGIDPAEFGDPRAKVPTSALPPKNAKGWVLAEDAQGNRAYVSPDGQQFEEVN